MGVLIAHIGESRSGVASKKFASVFEPQEHIHNI